MNSYFLIQTLLILIIYKSNYHDQLAYNLSCRGELVKIVLHNSTLDTLKIPRLDSENFRNSLVPNHEYKIMNDTLILYCINPYNIPDVFPITAPEEIKKTVMSPRVKAGIVPGQNYRVWLKIPEACKKERVKFFRIVSDEPIPPMIKDETLNLRGKQNWEIAY
jgi:hypothetical protein